VSGWGSAQLLKRTGPGPCPISAGAFCAGQSWADCITNTVGSDFRQAQALNTVEFRLRENNTGAFPRGIVFMLRALGSWLHGRDPVSPLAFEGPLAAVKAQVAGGKRYFERLLKRHLVDNRHRTVLVLKPDRDLAEREAQEERARLETVRASMTARDLQGVVEATNTLRRIQEQPDPPEALATIPTLTRSDLPPANKLIPCEVTSLSDTRVLYHDLFTNGVVYLDVGFDLHILPSELLPYVPLFGRALLETGVGNDDFVRLSQRIGRSTGGIRPQRWTSTIAGSVTSTAWLNLRGKASVSETPEIGAMKRISSLPCWLRCSARAFWKWCRRSLSITEAETPKCVLNGNGTRR